MHVGAWLGMPNILQAMLAREDPKKDLAKAWLGMPNILQAMRAERGSKKRT